MLSDNGGSAINSDGKWPGGLYGVGGWGSGSLGVGEADKELEVEGGRTVPVSKLLLIITLITNQLANRTGPWGSTLPQPVQN